MKKGLTLLAFTLMFGAAHAQLADGAKAPNLTFTDIDGNTHDLYADYLNQGKTVFLDIFASWCGPCWTLHSNHILENVYQQYGPDGTDEVRVFAIEGDPSTSHAELLGIGSNTWGDWTAGISYVMAEDNAAANLFNLSFYPTIYMIRPNGSVILVNDYCWDEYYDPNSTSLDDLINRGPNDVFTSTTLSDRVFCSSAAFTGSAKIKNMGTDTLTSVVVDMLFNGEVAQSKTWTGTLTDFKTANIFFTLTQISETTEITFRASLPNNEEDSYPGDNEDGLLYNFPVSNATVNFSLTTDFWPEEVSWKLRDPNGVVLYSNDDFGTLACNTTYEQTFEFSEEGCHTLVMADGFGDGLLNGLINPGSHSCPGAQDSIALGALELSSNGVVLYDNISYGTGVSVPFRFEMSSAVQPIAALESIAVFPNPANQYVDLQLNLSAATEMAIEVLDVTGKLLVQRASRSYPAGEHNEQFDVANFANGTYFVRMTEKHHVNTVKFTVIH